MLQGPVQAAPSGVPGATVTSDTCYDYGDCYYGMCQSHPPCGGCCACLSDCILEEEQEQEETSETED